jgi:hypothetical protein
VGLYQLACDSDPERVIAKWSKAHISATAALQRVEVSQHVSVTRVCELAVWCNGGVHMFRSMPEIQSLNRALRATSSSRCPHSMEQPMKRDVASH